MGRVLFYLLWPLVWMYAPITRRVRLVITHGDSLIVVKNVFGPGMWQLPGGGIKFGESVEAAALREAEEELGFELQKVQKLNNDFVVVKQFGLLMRYNYVLVELDSKRAIEKNRELTDAVWLEFEELDRAAQEVHVGLELARKQG